MQPEFEDEEAIDPFDFWQGANFKLKAKNVAGYRNYDSSEFAHQVLYLMMMQWNHSGKTVLTC